MNKLRSKIFNINSSKTFEEVCFEAFEFQVKQNDMYSSFSSMILRNKSPNTINEIPFLPIQFFKSHKIVVKNSQIEKRFISSGTSGNKSTHFICDTSIYNDSLKISFENHYGDVSNYCILCLLPNYIENPNSSIIYMASQLIQQSNREESGFFLDDYKKLSETISRLEKKQQKTILLGVSYALLDFAKEFPQKLSHTIIMETGGTKGMKNSMTKKELHERLRSSFGIKEVHSEYGMTELLSQSYSKEENIFISPPWKRILIRDINDPIKILGNNVAGGINIIDLANIYSCPFIATEDIGKTYINQTFSILGRLDNSDLRGCNLLEL